MTDCCVWSQLIDDLIKFKNDAKCEPTYLLLYGGGAKCLDAKRVYKELNVKVRTLSRPDAHLIRLIRLVG